MIINWDQFAQQNRNTISFLAIIKDAIQIKHEWV